jgi:hypothetical protein
MPIETGFLKVVASIKFKFKDIKLRSIWRVNFKKEKKYYIF